MKSRDEILTDRTIDIIKKGGRILLRKKDKNIILPKKDGWYLSSWTNIAGGPDHANWSKSRSALEIFNLKWAFTLAPLYDCKVVVRYPKK